MWYRGGDYREGRLWSSREQGMRCKEMGVGEGVCVYISLCMRICPSCILFPGCQGPGSSVLKVSLLYVLCINTGVKSILECMKNRLIIELRVCSQELKLSQVIIHKLILMLFEAHEPVLYLKCLLGIGELSCESHCKDIPACKLQAFSFALLTVQIYYPFLGMASLHK